MSLYHLSKEISMVANTKYIKSFSNDYVVAKFIKGGKTISLYYKNYSKKLLKQHMEKDYEEKLVYMDFWDPSFCSHENITSEDIRIIIQRLGIEDGDDQSRICVGYLLSLISLHKIILISYTERNYDIMKQSINFDKNIIRKLFCDIDMVIEFNNSLTNFINHVFDEDSIIDLLVTPSGKFRFIPLDIKYFLQGTKNVHEISSLIVKTNTDVQKILNYHLELVNVCGIIYSPELITYNKAENVLLNILKLDINLDKDERLLFRIIDKYIDKEGSLDIVFDLDNPQVLSLIDAVREYHLSSNQGSF